MINLYDSIKIHPDIARLITSRGLAFAYYDCPQKASLQQIYTSESYFLYALEGKKVFHFGGKSYLLQPGASVFIRKGGYYMERFKEEFKVMEIFLPKDYLSDVIQEIHSKLPAIKSEYQPLELVTELETNKAMQACIDSLLPYFSQTPPPADSILELKFKEFILNVLLNPKNNQIMGYFNHTLEQHSPSLQLVMEDNFMYNLSLKDYAKLCYRSLASFKREFIQLYCTTPGKWLLQKKLDYAKMLLNNTNKRISDVAFESGFESSSHFSRVFKDKFLLSPNECRKALAISNPVQAI